MILSVHLAQVGPAGALAWLRTRPRRGDLAGLHWAQTGATVPLAARAPFPNGVALIAAWADDLALDDFLTGHPLARRLAEGWHVRLEPLRASGAWSALPTLSECPQSVGDGEPVAVLTLGRLRVRRAAAFLRTTAPAEREAVADPSLALSTAIVCPPRFVATFSVWDSAAAMIAYAHGAGGTAHRHAIRAHRARPFHHESLFARFAPYRAQGVWGGLHPRAAEGAGGEMARGRRADR